MIYLVGTSWVISSGQMWLPGSYDSEKTARYAYQFSNVELETLEKAINHPPASRQITLDDLRALRRSRQLGDNSKEPPP